MGATTREYEKGWDVCVRCGTRRPVFTLESEVEGWRCRDLAWCLEQSGQAAGRTAEGQGNRPVGPAPAGERPPR